MANTYTAFINPNFDFETRVSIGIDIIKHIKQRTRQGKGIGGQPFRGPDGNNKYSASYKEHRDFETGGKTGQSTVNLTLTGDMLDSMEVIDARIPGKVVIGYKEGEESKKSIWMREKGYDFLGMTPEELTPILTRYDRTTPQTQITAGFASGLLRGILGIK